MIPSKRTMAPSPSSGRMNCRSLVLPAACSCSLSLSTSRWIGSPRTLNCTKPCSAMHGSQTKVFLPAKGLLGLGSICLAARAYTRAHIHTHTYYYFHTFTQPHTHAQLAKGTSPCSAPAGCDRALRSSGPCTSPAPALQGLLCRGLWCAGWSTAAGLRRSGRCQQV